MSNPDQMNLPIIRRLADAQLAEATKNSGGAIDFVRAQHDDFYDDQDPTVDFYAFLHALVERVHWRNEAEKQQYHDLITRIDTTAGKNDKMRGIRADKQLKPAKPMMPFRQDATQPWLTASPHDTSAPGRSLPSGTERVEIAGRTYLLIPENSNDE